jgi:hypothetical protein
VGIDPNDAWNIRARSTRVPPHRRLCRSAERVIAADHAWQRTAREHCFHRIA